MTRLKTLLYGTALAGSTFMAASAALAAPITVSPGPLIASGDVKAVFAYADAADTSQLLKIGVASVIFNNHIDAIGTTKDIGVTSGVVQFILDNLTTHTSFINDVADSDGNFHAKYGASAADFGVTFTNGANTAIAALVGPVTLVAFEDLTAG